MQALSSLLLPQVAINGGTTWAVVANGTVYTGVGTDTRTVLKPTTVMKTISTAV